MKLAAVFNIWADCFCLLPYAVENIRPVVDGVILVWSYKSNRGNVVQYELSSLPKDCILVNCEPQFHDPHRNEVAKRNAGLEAARNLGFTHFLMMDSDEFYNQDEFLANKGFFESRGYVGSVCRVKTYVKSPTLTIGYDSTIVPWVHSIRRNMRYELKFAGYPYAYQNGGAVIDPTRRVNLTQGVHMMNITMHHMCWVRDDYQMKMANSSANFKRPGRADMVLSDLRNAKEGHFSQMYQKTLMKCENQFNLPEYELV